MTVSDQNRKAVVVGHPIAHSRSPLIHRHWLAELGIAGAYDRRDVRPEDLEGFVRAMAGEGIAGANLTIPHKELVMAMVGQIDPEARAVGAANTIWFDEAGTLRATNTDVHGFLANLDERAPGWDAGGKTAMVFGAGGAARAVVFGLLSRGFEQVLIHNRSAERIAGLRDAFGAAVESAGAAREALAAADLVVNATSLGMHGAAAWTMPLDGLSPAAVVCDLVYVPLRTRLLELAEARGNRTVDGLGMLLHQAAPAFQRFFGQKPRVTESLRQRIVADLERGA